MFDVEEAIYTLLKNLQYDVFNGVVDPVQSPSSQHINIETLRQNLTALSSHGGQYTVNAMVGVQLMVLDKNNSWGLLKSFTEEVLQVIMSDLLVQNIVNLYPGIECEFNTEDAGETNCSSANIVLTCEYNTEFLPTIPDRLLHVHVDEDFIDPSTTPGQPDEEIEANFDVNFDP